jgi:glycine/D-amino acid oxidase-like deaminating enzyme
MSSYDVVIIGGGVVGTAIGCGLLQRGRSVAIIDQGATAFRASLGNQGMVWRQLKGFDDERYARLTKLAVDQWSDFATELATETGIDCAYWQNGGLSVAASEKELDEFRNILDKLGEIFVDEGGFEYEEFGRAKLESMYPSIGDDVPGAIYTPYDGVCNPLSILKALHKAFTSRNGRYVANTRVDTIVRDDGSGYHIQTSDGSATFTCEKLVLAAGLANKKLGALLGTDVPVSPNRGQILVTERLRDFDFLPCNCFRPNEEGTLLIGASSDDVGYDDSVDLHVAGNIAKGAIKLFPWLAKLRVIRIWAALRVMSPDGKPIYQELEESPGTFVATCHSGITLTPVHMNQVAQGIDEGFFRDEVGEFGMGRFNV